MRRDLLYTFCIIVLVFGLPEALAHDRASGAIDAQSPATNQVPVSEAVYEYAKSGAAKTKNPLAQALDLEDQVAAIQAKETAVAPELAKLLAEKYLPAANSGGCPVDAAKTKILSGPEAGVDTLSGGSHLGSYKGQLLQIEGKFNRTWIKIRIPVDSLVAKRVPGPSPDGKDYIRFFTRETYLVSDKVGKKRGTLYR